MNFTENKNADTREIDYQIVLNGSWLHWSLHTSIYLKKYCFFTGLVF